MVILLYAEWIKGQSLANCRTGVNKEGKEYLIPADLPWDESVTKEIYNLGCRVSVQLIHKVHRYYRSNP